jgi:spermidine/putrescine transport system ATP-binding protein
MQRELVKIKRELGITFVFVTHDQEEALSMSDTVVVMNQGWIQQIGTPENVYNEPENAFVADFIGDSNIIDGIMIKDKLVHILGRDIPCINTGFGKDAPVDVQIRPEDIQICAPEQGQFQGVIKQVVFKGTVYDITVLAAGFEWLVQTITGHEQGSEVGLRLAPANIQIMAKPASEDEEAVSDE